MNAEAINHANTAILAASTASTFLGADDDQSPVSHYGLSQLATAIEHLARAVAALVDKEGTGTSSESGHADE